MSGFSDAFKQKPKDDLNMDQSFKEAFDQKFDSSPNEIKDDITFSITLEDVDEAVFNWFSEDQPIKIDNKDVPVIFASAERWQYYQQDGTTFIRDPKTGLVILPVISIKRTSQPEMRERNVPLDKSGATNMFVAKAVSTIKNGSVLTPYALTGNLDNADAAVYEILSVRPMTWVKATYDVTIWTQYIADMNIAAEHMLNRMKALHSVYSSKGFSMYAMLDNATIQNNEDDYGTDERIFRTSFSINVEAPLIEKVRSTKLTRTVGRIRVKSEVILNKQAKEDFEWKSPYEIDL